MRFYTVLIISSLITFGVLMIPMMCGEEYPPLLIIIMSLSSIMLGDTLAKTKRK